jgi:hypothetical protein
MNTDEILARRRFTILSLVRLSGAAFLTVGLLSVAGKITVPQVAGFVLVAAGLANFLFVPRALARKWKSPRP